MKDHTSLVRLIKQLAAEAVDAERPTGLYIGTIKSLKPLTVQIDQRMTLGGPQLLQTATGAALKPGDLVALLREQGGQRYLIIDKVVPA